MKSFAQCVGLALALAGVVQRTRAADAAAAVDVEVARPARGAITRFVTLPGTLKPNQQATLYAKVPGYLKSLAVDKGDRVKAGQALGEIEVPELVADRVKYVAEVKVAEAEAKRLAAAREKAGDLVVPQALDEATGRLEIAQASLERTETLLRYSRLTAPFDGMVTARYVDPGAFIPAATSGSAAQTAAVLTVMDFTVVRLQVAVPEQEAARVRVGQPVRLVVDGLPGKVFEAKVSRLAYALDEATRTMLVEADCSNRSGELRPGMFADVKLGVDTHENAWLIPSAALVMEQGNARVFVAADGKAKKLSIRVGFNDGERVEVLEGLQGNEDVILSGPSGLADGRAVKAAPAVPPASQTPGVRP